MILVLFSIVLVIIGTYTVMGLVYVRFKANTEQATDLYNAKSLPFVSVLVAFRNEEQYIIELIESLAGQSYPSENFEIILINDHSEDLSVEYCMSKSIKNLSVIHLPQGLSGKKEALQQGLQIAHGELLLFTDADCMVPKDWIQAHAYHYRAQGNPDLTIGMVDLFPEKRWWFKLQRLEWLSLIISGVGLAQSGRSIMCNGANLAVKSSSYPKIDYVQQGSPSGDDVFLLHYLKGKKAKIETITSVDSIVKTHAMQDISSIINQRKRWASKAAAYTELDSIIVSILVFSTSLAIVASAILSFLSGNLTLFLLPVGIKYLVDCKILFPAMPLFGYKYFWMIAFPLSLIYPFFVLFSALAGLKRPFHWKGRNYSGVSLYQGK